MSLLVQGGRVPAGRRGHHRHHDHRRGRAVVEPAPVGFRATRVRPGEVRRPPTRGTGLSVNRRQAPAVCMPRQVPVRWPWLLALAVGSALMVVTLGALGAGVTGTSVPVPEQTTLVSVGQGETLSELAERFAPGSDTQEVVRRIQLLNDLDGVGVPVGLPLAVPYRAASVLPAP